MELLDRYIPKQLDLADTQRARFVLAMMLVSMATAVLATIPSTIAGELQLANFSGIVGLFFLNLVTWFVLRRVSVQAAVVLFLSAGWMGVNVLSAVTGGLNSPAYVSNAVVLVFASMVARPWQASIVLGMSVGVGIGFWQMDDTFAAITLIRPNSIDTLLSSTFLFGLSSVLVMAMASLQERDARASQDRQRELERAWERLEQTSVSTNYMRSVLAAARDMIVVTDEELVVVDMNPAVTELLGWTRVEMVGKPLAQFGAFPFDGRRNLVAITSTMHRADGRDLPVMISRGRLDSVAGSSGLTGFVFAISDTTVQEAAVEAVRRAHGHAEAANQAKSRFLANMSHELRTPLNAIIGYSELLAEEIEAQHQREDLDRVRGAARHLLQLINGILDLSKVEAGKTRLDVTAVMLDPLVHDAVATVRPNLMDGVDFHVEATDLGTARLDEVKTRQILLNLLTNALKFTTVGEVRLSVERWDREGMPWLRFVVQDTGIGIHADQLERIFEPFAQADATTERKFGGTGLGLSISQAFTRMMGGEIYVTSEVGSGTRFTVELPIGELRQLRTPGQALRTAMPAREGGELILCIDDDRSALELLSRLLSTETRQVVGTPDPEQGLQWARALRPNLLTVDVQMPRMSGWNVLAQIQSDPELRDIPCIVITAEGEEQVAHALGAAAMLHKPVERVVLVDLVEDVFRRSRASKG